MYKDARQGKFVETYHDCIHVRYLFHEVMMVPRHLVSLPANMDKTLYFGLPSWLVLRIGEKFQLSQDRMIEVCVCFLTINVTDLFYEAFDHIPEHEDLGHLPIPCLFMEMVIDGMNHNSLALAPGYGCHGVTFNHPITIVYWVYVLKVLNYIVNLANAGQIR